MENDVLNSVLAFASILAPIILALVQLVKKSVPLPNNSIPLVGLVVGLLIGAVAYSFTDLHVSERLWAGGLAGLSATGLFELIFSDRKGITKSKDKAI